MKFVRIRPHNKARGQLVRRYVYGGFRFEAALGWYEVDDEIAEYLEKVLTFPQDPDSKPVFDVKDKQGAEDLAREEYEAENPERKIAEAVAGRQKVTVADLEGAAAAKTEEAEPAKAAEESAPSVPVVTVKEPEPEPEKVAEKPKASTTPAKSKTAASGKKRRSKFTD